MKEKKNQRRERKKMNLLEGGRELSWRRTAKGEGGGRGRARVRGRRRKKMEGSGSGRKEKENKRKKRMEEISQDEREKIRE